MYKHQTRINLFIITAMLILISVKQMQMMLME